MSEFAIREDASPRRNTRDAYCIVCTVPMHEETWKSHSTTLSHMANAKRFDLVFEKRKGAGLSCNICGATLGWEGIREHEKQHFLIPWDRVEDNYDKYEIFFDNLIVEWRSAYRCYACDLTFPEWSTALVHVVDGEHRARVSRSTRQLREVAANGAPSYELLVKEGLLATDSPSSLECMVCDARSVLLDNAPRHVKGLAHVSNRSRFAFGPSEILEEDTHQEDEECPSPALCDYVAKKNYRTYRCVVCDCEFDAERKAEHLMSAEHAISLRLHRCDAVSLRNGRDYYCDACDCHIAGLFDVYRHVRKSQHCAAAEASETKDEAIGEIRDFWLVRLDENYWKCVICDRVVSSLSEVTRNHVTGRYHRNSRKIHGFDAIETCDPGSYGCRACDLAFNSLEQLHRHVSEAAHLNSLSRKTIEEETSLGTEVSRYFFKYYILKIDQDDFRCVLCNVDLSASETSIASHVAGTGHADSINKYGFRSVSKIGDDVYYCGACRCAIRGRWEVYSHTMEEKHLSLTGRANTESRSKEEIPKSAAKVASMRLLSVGKNEANLRSEAQHIEQRLESKEEMPKNAVQMISMKSPPAGSEQGVLRSVALRGVQQIDSKKESMKNAARTISIESAPIGSRDQVIRSKAQQGAQQLNSNKVSKEEMPKNSVQMISMKSPPAGSEQGVLQSVALRGVQQLDSKKESMKNAARTISIESAPIGSRDQVIRSKAQQGAHQLNSKKVSKEEMSANTAQTLSMKSPPARSKEQVLQSKAQQGAQRLNSKVKMQRNTAQTLSTKLPPAESKEQVLQSKTLRGAQQLEKKENEEMSSGKEDDFIRDYILKVWDKIYFCFVCECQVHPLAGNCDAHVQASAHKEAICRYGCDRINFEGGAYRCDCCDFRMRDFQAVCLHVKEKSHVDRLDPVNDKSTETLQPRSSSQSSGDVCEANDIMYYVTVFEGTRAFCEICECNLNLSHRNITNHIMGKAHGTSLRQFGCENILKLSDRTYNCKCCNYSTKNLADVYTHVKNSRHLALAQKQSGKVNPKLPETNKQDRTSNCENLKKTKPEKTANSPKKVEAKSPIEKCTLNDIVSIEGNKYFCHCCNCTVSGDENFYEHARGKKHVAALSKRLSKDSLH